MILTHWILPPKSKFQAFTQVHIIYKLNIIHNFHKVGMIYQVPIHVVHKVGIKHK